MIDVLNRITRILLLLLWAPLPIIASPESDWPHQTVVARILLTGDTMLSRYIGEQIEARNDPTYPFERLRDYLVTFDLVTTNLESPVSTRGVDQGQLYPFRAHPRVVSGLTAANIGLVNLANNHVFDFGNAAAIDTLTHLEAAGIGVVGAAQTADDARAPLVRTWNDVTVAFLGFTNLYGAYRPDTAASFFIAPLASTEMETAVRAARAAADIVIVQLHWGWEYETPPRSWQRDTAARLIRAGADIVAGHHPHVIQEYGPVDNGFVAYSLGNFIFDQNFSPETARGLVLEVDIHADATVAVRPREIAFAPGYQPFLVD